MALKTRLTDLLKVQHPIMLAGMGGVSYAEVCAAMCNAGGYGVLGMAGTSPQFIAGQMKKVRELTDKPFGVDLLAASPESLEESVDVIIKGGDHLPDMDADEYCIRDGIIVVKKGATIPDGARIM